MFSTRLLIFKSTQFLFSLCYYQYKSTIRAVIENEIDNVNEFA